MEELVTKYNTFITKLNPSLPWKVTRFVLHWLTLPLKVFAIATLGLYQIVSKSFLKPRKALIYTVHHEYLKKSFFQKVFNSLPVYKDTGVMEELYVNRVPLSASVDGTNHNIDHQCSRQGTYAFLMTKLGKRNSAIDFSLAQHIVNGNLARGYKKHFLDGDNIYNMEHVSGDMLCGMALGMLGTESTFLKERFKLLVENIIKNDYAVLEHTLATKSERGMWQPGLETVGAQALTLLTALRVADKICGSELARKEYNKMLLTYGYGLLSLFPTAYIDSKRGYYNDHNCLMCVYILTQLADSRLGRSFWAVPLTYIWLLSRHWYNGYFTGLVRECLPWLIPQSYVDKCKAYLYEQEPRTWGADVGYEYTTEFPVHYNQIPEDEFSPDIKQNIMMTNVTESDKIYTGLGYIAQVIMLEKNPKELL